MIKFNILHITDLHLHDTSTSSQEYLREDYYKKYIENLKNVLQDSKTEINFIIITGDIVDRYKHENFSHATNIIKYLYNELELNEKSIGVCIGNHDYDNQLKENNELQKAREHFHSFADNYVNGYNKIVDGSFYTISKFNDTIAFISLDSTYGTRIPAKLSEEDINKLIKDIQVNALGDFEVIIIASHFPLVFFPNYPFPDKEGWYDSHFWKSGSFLRIRIEEELSNTRKIWLFGDTHQPGTWTNESSTYVMTGRFGTKIEETTKDNIKYFSNINRQASLIKLDNNNIQVDIIQHYSLEHSESSLRGKWAMSNLGIKKIKLIRPEIIDTSIEEKILEKIINDKLYRFGRFSTNGDYDILGWVFINDLLNSHSLLTDIITSCKKWINDKGIRLNNKTLIIGIDHWGGIISSHLSILTGIKNLPLPSRGNHSHYSNAELLEQNKVLLNKTYNSIILIIDVVNTGKTIVKIIHQLKEILDVEDDCEYNCISILSDTKQNKTKSLLDLNSFGTFCGKLRQPIVFKDFLPSEILLERKNYFNE